MARCWGRWGRVAGRGEEIVIGKKKWKLVIGQTFGLLTLLAVRVGGRHFLVPLALRFYLL